MLLGFNSLFIHRNHKLNKQQVACGQCIPGARVDIESTSASLYDHSDRTDGEPRTGPPRVSHSS